MSVEIVLDPGGANEVTIPQADIVDINPVLTHTGIGDFVFTLATSEKYIEYAQRQDRLNLSIDGSVEFTGYLTDTSEDKETGVVTLEGLGIAKRLEETRPDYSSLGGSLTYTNIALEDAIDDYWSRTPFSNYSVTPQSTEQVATDTQVQSADTSTEWNNLVSPPSDKPITVNNGKLELQQSSWTIEAENPDSVGAFTISDSEFSGGTGVRHEQTNDSYIYEITPQYDIAAGDVGIYIRDELLDNGRSTDGIELYFNGDRLQEIDAVNFFLGWRDLTGLYSGGDLTAGNTYQFEIRSLSSTTNPTDYRADVINVHDSRYTYNFDNDNGGSGGYLDGPELFPDSSQIELSETTTSFNISSATVSSTWNDTSNNQAISVSNDGGSSYQTANNTSSTTQSFSSAGRTAQTRFTFSRYGSRTTATPQTGFNGQSIDDYTLTVDGNDLVVIDELELSRNHFENLQTLHEYGDFQWTIEHGSADISNLTVTSYQRGDESRSRLSSFNDPVSQNEEIRSKRYYNSIYLQGGLDANGDRPVAEEKDQDEINEVGREISPGVLRDPKIVTEAGAVFRARALLNEATKENRRTGTITVPLTTAHPGYARNSVFADGQSLTVAAGEAYTIPVNETEIYENVTVDGTLVVDGTLIVYETLDDNGTVDDNGTIKTGLGIPTQVVEEVELSLSNDEALATFRLIPPRRIDRDISELRDNARRLGDKV